MSRSQFISLPTPLPLGEFAFRDLLEITGEAACYIRMKTYSNPFMQDRRSSFVVDRLPLRHRLDVHLVGVAAHGPRRHVPHVLADQIFAPAVPPLFQPSVDVR